MKTREAVRLCESWRLGWVCEKRKGTWHCGAVRWTTLRLWSTVAHKQCVMIQGFLLEKNVLFSTPWGKMQGFDLYLPLLHRKRNVETAYLEVDAESSDPVTKAEESSANVTGFPGTIALQPWAQQRGSHT